MKRSSLLLALLLVCLPLRAQDHPTQNPDASTYQLPPAAIQAAFEADKNYAVLDNLSPDGVHFLVRHETELSTLDLMARTTYRLAELEFRPETNRPWRIDTYGIDGIRFYSLTDRAFVDVDLPAGSLASDFTWSPDGSALAFLAHLPTHTEVWTANPATGRAERRSRRAVAAVLGTSARGQGTRPSSMLQWRPGGGLVTLLVPESRGDEPIYDPVPNGPTKRSTRDEPLSTRTYPFLLDSPHDEDLLEHYTTSQLVEIDTRGRVRTLGEPAMWESLSVSPDGGHVLATRMERPFSYRVPYSRFPRRTVVIDLATGDETELDYRPLREASDGGPDRRDIGWAPAGLTFLDRAPEDSTDTDAARPYRLMRAEAPFDLDAAEVVVTSDERIDEATFSADARFVFGELSKDGESAVAVWDLTAPDGGRVMLHDFEDIDDPTESRGDLMTARTGNGIPYAVTDGVGALFSGPGYQRDFRHRPFVDRIAFADASRARVFEGSTDSFDEPLVPLAPDGSRMIVSRESQSDFPDSFLWENGAFTRLTDNVDPFPAVTAAQRIDFSFDRRDGVTVRGRVSLPIGYEEGTRVPAIFWTYPREFTTAERYEHDTLRRRNHNAFTHMSWLRWSNLWLMAGYALVYPDIPIIGENYNDTYIGNLVDAMYGAIRAVDGLGVVDIDRLAHGGHSYGAFATANILANAPFFKAGIAGDGAYNRSLTPSGFQAERRTIWEAPHTYIEMSPFFKADQLDTPILLYHGADDDNTGTFPVQSRRFIHALTENGKTAVLYEYPYESHTPRAIENKLDMWARFIGWLDTYIGDKDAEDGD